MKDKNYNGLEFFTEKFLNLDIDTIILQLKKNGYFAFSQAITESTISQIYQDATKQKLNMNNNDIRGVYNEKQYFFTNLLAVSKKFYDFVTSELVLNICKNYLGNSFRLKALRYYETYGKHSMQWHTDNKTDRKFSDIPGLIFIFYISNVDDGHFQYIEGSHLWSGEKAYNNYSDEFIQKNYKEKIKDFKFPSGSLIIYNTYGIHRAKPVLSKKFIRKSVFFQVDSEIENSEPIILNTQYIKTVNDELKMFLGFGKKSDYEVYPMTSLNSVPLKKIIIKVFMKYFLYRFLNKIKTFIPTKIKNFLKKITVYFKKN